MFSSIFGKRRSSPVEDDTPPIPGPKSDDGFVILDTSRVESLYPNVSGNQYPPRPTPAPPVARRVNSDQTFHYLQGVPFSLSREIQMSTNKDAFATEIGDMLPFLTSTLNMSGYNYNFSAEKSVLKEC